ncbi:MAG: hypothetical protein AAF772_18730, partial [Acidobacteriota bacterium]
QNDSLKLIHDAALQRPGQRTPEAQRVLDKATEILGVSEQDLTDWDTLQHSASQLHGTPSDPRENRLLLSDLGIQRNHRVSNSATAAATFEHLGRYVSGQSDDIQPLLDLYREVGRESNRPNPNQRGEEAAQEIQQLADRLKDYAANNTRPNGQPFDLSTERGATTFFNAAKQAGIFEPQALRNTIDKVADSSDNLRFGDGKLNEDIGGHYDANLDGPGGRMTPVSDVSYQALQNAFADSSPSVRDEVFAQRNDDGTLITSSHRPGAPSDNHFLPIDPAPSPSTMPDVTVADADNDFDDELIAIADQHAADNGNGTSSGGNASAFSPVGGTDRGLNVSFGDPQGTGGNTPILTPIAQQGAPPPADNGFANALGDPPPAYDDSPPAYDDPMMVDDGFASGFQPSDTAFEPPTDGSTDRGFDAGGSTDRGVSTDDPDGPDGPRGPHGPSYTLGLDNISQENYVGGSAVAGYESVSVHELDGGFTYQRREIAGAYAEGAAYGGVERGPGSITASGGATATAGVGVVAEGHIGNDYAQAYYRGQVGLEGQATVGGTATVSTLGVSAAAEANVRATVISAQVGASVNTPSLNIGGEEIYAHAGGDAEAFVGSEAGGEAALTVGANGVNAEAGVEAFAGAKASASGTVGIGDEAQATGEAEAWAGIGFEAEANAGFEDGKLSVGFDVGAALGIGGSLSADVELDLGEISDTFNALLFNTAMQGIEGFDNFGEGVLLGTANIASNVAGGAKDLAQGAADLAGDAVDGAKDLANDAVDGVKNAAKKAKKKAKKAKFW